MVKSKQTDQVYNLKGKVKAETPKAVLIEYWRDKAQHKEVWVPKSVGEFENMTTHFEKMFKVGEQATVAIPEWFIDKNGLEDHIS